MLGTRLFQNEHYMHPRKNYEIQSLLRARLHETRGELEPV